MDETIKLNVKALAACKEVSIEELAKKADINVNHLLQVSCGRLKMTAEDLLKLSKVTGVPPFNILP